MKTDFGTFSCTILYKRVINLTLRFGRDGKIFLTVPYRTTLQEADRMVVQHARWLAGRLELQKAAIPLESLPPQRILQQSLDRVGPLTDPFGVPRPKLRLRAMKTQWGNCHMYQGYITLNTALVRCPEDLRDYVALHELVHFLHPNHGAGFYAAMDHLMPAWKDRRSQLSRFVNALQGS